jgi:hypothetical protein
MFQMMNLPTFRAVKIFGGITVLIYQQLGTSLLCEAYNDFAIDNFQIHRIDELRALEAISVKDWQCILQQTQRKPVRRTQKEPDGAVEEKTGYLVGDLRWSQSALHYC